MEVELGKILEGALTSILSNIGGKATDVSADHLKDILTKTKSKAGDSIGKEIEDIDSIADAVAEQFTSRTGRPQYTADVLARWLEIPEPDLSGVDTENLDINVMVQHIILEQKFKTWLEKWGYSVELGETLLPIDAPELECVVDVYGKLETIHGTFEVAVNFVCDDPPDENRVLALASKMAAYADSRNTFASNDVLMIVTPKDFTPIANASLRQQNKKKDYCVLGIDGGILHDLESSEDDADRLQELQEHVERANREAENSR